MISQQLPASPEIMPVVARRFNDKMRYNWDRVVEFLKLHYVLSERDDSDYWRDCRAISSCPDELQDKLTLWQQQPPWHEDAPRVDELFPSASYQFVLFGMGFEPQYRSGYGAGGRQDRQRIDKLLHETNETGRRMLQMLPTNRDLLNQITSAGTAAA